MNIAIILAGGTGTRLGADIPKQYIEVGGKPIIAYCLEKFENHPRIDDVIVVAAPAWIPFVEEWTERCAFKKVSACVQGGSSRQHSIMNGLAYLKEKQVSDDALVIIHDAARPCVTDALIDALIDGLGDACGTMPVLPVKDTIYLSKDGTKIDGLLNRSELFAGQAPELFRFGPYYDINCVLSEAELETVRGTSEIAYRNGLSVNLVPGDEDNYKITTKADLERFMTQTL